MKTKDSTVTPFSMKMPSLYLCLLVMTVGIAGCVPKSMIVGQMADLVDTGMVAFERDTDLDMIEKAMPSHIKLLEALLANDPDDGPLMTLLSRLYGSYTFAFIETRLEAERFATGPQATNPQEIDRLNRQASRYYEIGTAYALKALEKAAPGAADAFLKVNTVSPYLQKVDVDAVAPLFWYGFNLGGWVNQNLDAVRAISQAHVARDVMERVIELDPAFQHGGAYLFLVAYFGSRPPMMGGNPEVARRHYLQLKALTGDAYLLPDLIYARFCLPQKQDRKGFIDTMQHIADRSAMEGELALYNAIAVRRAAIYLSMVDFFFE